MTQKALEDARKAVARAVAQSERDEQERALGNATHAAVLRTAAIHRSNGVERFARQNGLVLAAVALFLVSFVGQVLSGRAVYNDDQREHGGAVVSVAQYLHTGAFVEATAENWESEFLQMGVFVVLTIFLYQRGSSESKQIEVPESVDQRPEDARSNHDAPWPVRRGGWALRIYKHSLSIALFTLFAISFALHAAGGASAFSEEQRAHGGSAVSALGYLATSQFWFESFQNWQSEFLSVGVLVLLSIWLREQGSSQSKPVAAPHSETGE